MTCSILGNIEKSSVPMLIRYFSYLCGHIASKASKEKKGSWLEKIEYNGGEETMQQKKACVITEIWRSWDYDPAQCLKQLPTDWCSSLEIYKNMERENWLYKVVLWLPCEPWDMYTSYMHIRQTGTYTCIHSTVHIIQYNYCIHSYIYMYLNTNVFEFNCIWIHLYTFLYMCIYMVCVTERERENWWNLQWHILPSSLPTLFSDVTIVPWGILNNVKSCK